VEKLLRRPAHSLRVLLEAVLGQQVCAAHMELAAL
jgi:hypothetical protein